MSANPHHGCGSELRRALQLLLLLSERRWVTSAMTAEALAVTPRTARRWLAAVSEAGWPLEHRGDHSAYEYRLVDGRAKTLALH